MRRLKIISFIAVSVTGILLGLRLFGENRRFGETDVPNTGTAIDIYKSSELQSNRHYIDSLAGSLRGAETIEGFNDFALSLAKLFRIEHRGNYIFSPLGVAFNLSMLSNGAAGKTRQEIFSVLGVSKEQNPLNSLNRFCSVMDIVLNYSDSAESALLTNSLWIDDKFTVKTSFVDTCKSVYHTDVFIRDLPSEETKNEINELVSARTGGLIPQFLTSTLDPFQKSALLNTIYINATWDDKFNPRYTKQNYPFNNVNGTKGRCDMMETSDNAYEVVKFENFSIIRFPLDSAKLGFDVVLPHPGVDVKDCLSKIKGSDITKWNEKSIRVYWNIIKVPKFDIETTGIFSNNLEILGLRNMFADKGNFSNLSTDKSFFVSYILQKARFKANEKGAEAAAATMDVAVGHDFEHYHEPTKLILDRPFMYLLTDTRTNAIIFIGEIRGF